MDKLYQNYQIFREDFSTNNSDAISKLNNKTLNILFCLMLIPIIMIIYFLILGLGFLTTYILNYQSYNILSGCPLNELNCSTPQIFCSGGTNSSIFSRCLLTGVVSFFILFICTLILLCVGTSISYTIVFIIRNICKIFDKAKQSITIYGSTAVIRNFKIPNGKSSDFYETLGLTLDNSYLNMNNDIKLNELNNFKLDIVNVD